MESAVILHVVGTVVGLADGGGLCGGGFTDYEYSMVAFLAGAIGVTCLAAVNRTVPIVGVATFCAPPSPVSWSWPDL